MNNAKRIKVNISSFNNIPVRNLSILDGILMTVLVSLLVLVLTWIFLFLR